MKPLRKLLIDGEKAGSSSEMESRMEYWISLYPVETIVKQKKPFDESDRWIFKAYGCSVGSQPMVARSTPGQSHEE